MVKLFLFFGEGLNFCVFSVIVVLKLAEIERLLAQKGRFEYISVQVAVSLTWFIRRLASNYLGFDEHSYENGQIPPLTGDGSISLSLVVSQSNVGVYFRQRK